METFAPNDKADYYSGITSITVNGKNAYELNRKFLDDLHNNDFSGTNGKDVIEHIEYYLKIIDPIKLPNVDHDKLRIVVFLILLAGGTWKCDKEETVKIFKIETDVFDYETPLCLAFNEFNYLLKVDPDLLTKDIMGFKTYEDYKDDWIQQWNKIYMVDEKPWTDPGVWTEPKPVKHTCKPFNYKTGYFKDFEKEFPAIVYNDALTSKLDFLTEPTVSPQHIDEFDLKDKISLSECDEDEQNVLYFNDVFPFNVIYPDDLKSDKDNDDDKNRYDTIFGGNVINTDDDAYARGSNKFLETSHDTSSKFFKTEFFYKELNVDFAAWN
ncbi:hypothetical protein Tco_1111839 [Tanacetum coccineum]|uniref:Uncharacterized protein n=1 Tax=Tanacetum coccineum TaxID=301880 RepID=A0ABQ5IN79_9ASTR